VADEIRIHVVGLGPGNPEHVTAETRALLTGGPVILRTRHHPSAEGLAPGARDCDDLYSAGASFDDVYAGVVARVMAQAAKGPIVYAVPGHPLFAERTVSMLLEAAERDGIRTKVYPAISFVDVAAAALRVDFGTVQVCDATKFRIDTQRPALIHQVFDRDTVTSLKLELLDTYPPEHEAVVLSALGTAEESIHRTTVAELDHRPFGYLDTVYLPRLEALADVRRFDGLLHVVRSLLAPDGCPWDREQTHLSLRPYLLEETYEALEAIDSGDQAALTEELGDVLLQVVLHTAIAECAGEFGIGDVVEHITRKLVSRHPHVFGDGTAKTAAEVEQNWEELKKAEKQGRESILDGVPKDLPALAASQSIQGRARKVGFDWPDIEGQLEKLAEELREFAHAEGDANREDEFGDVLAVVAGIAQRLDIDAEQALRRANDKFRRRFGHIEARVAERGEDLRDLELAQMDELWNEAKALERQSL
jgi:tetrapyrrole methylase family protein/MazG family protein